MFKLVFKKKLKMTYVRNGGWKWCATTDISE